MKRKDVTKELASEVKYYREEVGLNVRTVSKFMNISMQDVTKIINSKVYKEVTAEEPSERDTHWKMEGIRDLSTEQIIQKLRHFGVEFSEERFLKDVKNLYSPGKLADHWMEIHPVTAKGFDEDFIWMAATILWERLAPNVVNSEQINEAMQKGYDLMAENNTREGCEKWLETWGLIREVTPPEVTTLGEIDGILRMTQSVFNWCQDFEMELRNAGRRDKKYYRELIDYVNEFFSTFPDHENELIDLNMRRAEADSYFELGEFARGEEKYEELTERHPNNVYGYLSWGDQYCWDRAKPEPDYERAENLYLSGLENALKGDREGDVEAALNRLEDLYEKTSDPEKIEIVKEEYGL
ncbi:hypothetical protein AKJ44_01920 [candidate division MSBL1 archaeon SCGC-AAA261F17]|uniref:Uncharacterized protein n=1 Tax=candidate division MSBL1 archaeon SCGC-AAA261F17 TaxID=1698274 RepID=A0A133V640_9EURY|nr:hypothetical protein AKJ44_01920 [candidate division MSBL1 archaeon SCGC-AAA261F17]